MPKYYDKRTHAHEQAVHWVGTQVYAMRSTFNRQAVEAGIDGMVDLADPQTGAATGAFLGVQVKTKEQFAAESDKQFSFYAEPEDIAYWNTVQIPVLLVVVRSRTEEAYAVHVQGYFGKLENKNSKTVVFDKGEDRFAVTEDWQRRLLNLGVPRSRGLSFPPVPMPEEMASNLLEAVLPETLFCGKTRYKTRDSMLGILKDRDFNGTEFIVRDGYLWSVRSLHLNIWKNLVDSTTVKPMSFAELAFHDQPAKRRHATELLNHCLTARLDVEEVRWLEDERFYVYLPNRSLTRTVRTTVQREERESKKGLLHVKSKGERILFCRHVAMKANFVEIENTYYLQVDPTYYYTRDGKKKHRRWAEFIRNVRNMEKQREYWSNLQLWRHVLTHPSDMLREDYAFLKFRDYLGFLAPVSIPDSLWIPQANQEEPVEGQTEFEY